MKVAITGHTAGIGKAIHNYFKLKEYECTGFSKRNGFDINNPENRKQIIELSKDSSIFVNCAYSNFNNSQLEVLKAIINEYKGQEKIIINISSRITDLDTPAIFELYKKTKQDIDNLCKIQRSKPWVINLKPGLTDTNRVAGIQENKMSTESIVKIIDFILCNQKEFKVNQITFGL